MAKDDGDLWREVAGSVTPLRGKKIPPPSPRKPKPETKKPEAARGAKTESKAQAPVQAQSENPRKQQRKLPANLDGESFGGISAADAKRLKSGHTKITARLDLHGMTLTEARSKLTRFVIAHSDGKTKSVLVITGKGRDGRGVIREQLPGWLRDGDIAPHVIAFCHAMPRDGGAGAFYLRLRPRPSP